MANSNLMNNDSIKKTEAKLNTSYKLMDVHGINRKTMNPGNGKLEVKYHYVRIIFCYSQKGRKDYIP